MVDGGTLTATGCWFANFDHALDVACFGASESKVTQCMFVSTKPEPAAGWALRLRSMSGGFAKTGRRLVMDHCTVKGAGVVAFEGFSPSDPTTVETSGCAVLADALIAWGPNGKDAPPPARNAVSWIGRADLFDIRGKSWIVLANPGATGSVAADARRPGRSRRVDQAPRRRAGSGPAAGEVRDRSVGAARSPDAAGFRRNGRVREPDRRQPGPRRAVSDARQDITPINTSIGRSLRPPFVTQQMLA